MVGVVSSWWGRQSVKLDDSSELYQYVMALREQIVPVFPKVDMRIPHIEIYSKYELQNNYDKNRNYEQLKSIDVDYKNIDNYCLLGRAFVLNIGKINGTMRHITIAYGFSNGDLSKLKNLTQKFLIDK